MQYHIKYSKEASPGSSSLKCDSVLKSYFIKEKNKSMFDFVYNELYRATISILLLARAEQILTDDSWIHLKPIKQTPGGQELVSTFYPLRGYKV